MPDSVRIKLRDSPGMRHRPPRKHHPALEHIHRVQRSIDASEGGHQIVVSQENPNLNNHRLQIVSPIKKRVTSAE